VKSGIGELDEYVLQGGVERGVVLGISGDEGSGVGRLVSLFSFCL
jgi:RecA/RadA recombinase